MTRPLYQISNWQQHYENAKSRTIERKGYGTFPIKQDGLGYRRLVSQPDGAALYGAFIAVTMICHKQSGIRQGYLTDTGGADGYPLDENDMALITGMPADVIARMLSFCTSASMGWIAVCNARDTAGIPQYPPSIPEVSPLEDRKDRKGKNKRGCVFTPPTPSEVESYSQEIGYPMNGQAWCDAYAQKDWRIGKNKMKDWKAAVRNWKAQKWTPTAQKGNPGTDLPNTWHSDKPSQHIGAF